jgi:hypothetical protein
MDGNRVSDLQRMYGLFSRVGALDVLRPAFSSYVKVTGQAVRASFHTTFFYLYLNDNPQKGAIIVLDNCYCSLGCVSSQCFGVGRMCLSGREAR